MHIKVASFPGRGKENPYVDLFYDALAPHGIALVSELKMDVDWLIKNRTQFDAIHLHWPEVLWRTYKPKKPGRTRTFLRKYIPSYWRILKHTDSIAFEILSSQKKLLADKIRGYFYFRQFIAKARQYGLCIIWTAHNAEAHEGTDIIDRLGYKYLAKSADLVILHSQYSKNEFLNRYKTDAQCIVMPHGNYDGVYPPPRVRETILNELKLRDDLPIVSCIGMLRDYKGIDLAINALSKLDGQVQFLCAGAPHPSFDIETLKSRISKMDNAILIPEFLSNQEFTDFVSISECLLMPYKKITGSGALLASLTLSRGVIASDLPYFRELLEGNCNAGRLVDATNASEFAINIRNYLEIPSELRHQSARSLADKNSWNNVVLPVKEAIRAWNTTHLS